LSKSLISYNILLYMINFSKLEEEVIRFWQEQKIFKKTLKKESSKGDFVFYDGPPFATGTPHYGHLVAGTLKDIIPRFRTMQGYHVDRKWGWDCHGLPIENIIEKKLNLKNRQDIENIGVEEFCDSCRAEVLKYAEEWRKVVDRMGRWVDMDDDYKTMNPEYMESIWWVFKSLWDKDLIYEGYKSMHICPRCETTLSNFEVTQNYQDVKDLSVTAKFELVDEPGTYLLAWTTTPWTLIGNVALAVGNNIKYVAVNNNQGEKLILSKDYYDNNKEKFNSVENEFKGKDLIGKKYQPLFNYYSETSIENNGWQVYEADFITTDEGTGIVHIAPAFGEEDMELGREKKLPFVQHVDMSGKFKPEVKDFADLAVKPIDNVQATDRKIVDWLDKQNKVFTSEEYQHSYPHCWRCDTPLLNYAASSWFVKVTDIKNKLIKNNQKINWVPEHMKDGRFGKWIEQAKDWAISRSRFWGAPLPVWRCEKCEETKVLGSIEELQKQTGDKITKLILLRHGQSEKNVKDIFDSSDDAFPLTPLGRKQAEEAAKKLKDVKIDKIFVSSVLRARETAEIISAKKGIKPEIARELVEVRSGNWEPKNRYDESIQETRKQYKSLSMDEQYVAVRGETGETWKECEERMYGFTKKVIKENPGQTILLVSHQAPLVYLLKALKDLSIQDTAKHFDFDIMQQCAQPIEIFVDNQVLKQVDIHKHQVDQMHWPCPKCSGQMTRVPEVLDCWFESGSMPYGQSHYPFADKEKFEENFPAQFIAEGQDQTRGWFYTLLVLSTALFDKPAYLNVVANGLVLAADGKKMSKRLKNYPEPSEVMNKYGADVMRLYLVNGPVVKAEELRFDEKEVRDLFNKTVGLIWNVFTFYQLFEKQEVDLDIESDNTLDIWIKAKLNLLVGDITLELEKYDLMKATRSIVEFINELSTWYLRRSRERFKSSNEAERQKAQATLYQVLFKLSITIAPFMPFVTEKIYQELNGSQESVHLEEWPRFNKISKKEENLLTGMQTARKIVEEGLAERAKAGIKVRQPLQFYQTPLAKGLSKDFIGIIIDELNVREVKVGEQKLDLEISPELKAEGLFRELVRAINNFRKENKLTINDKVSILYQTDSSELAEVITKFEEEIKENTRCLSIEAVSGNQAKELAQTADQKINDILIKFIIK